MTEEAEIGSTTSASLVHKDKVTQTEPYLAHEVSESAYGVSFNLITTNPDSLTAVSEADISLNSGDEIDRVFDEQATPWSRERFSSVLRETYAAHEKVSSISQQEPSLPRIRVVFSEDDQPLLYSPWSSSYIVNLGATPIDPQLVWHEAGHELQAQARGGQDGSELYTKEDGNKTVVMKGVPDNIVFYQSCLEKGGHPHLDNFTFPEGVTRDTEQMRNAAFIFSIEEILAHKFAETILGKEAYGKLAAATIKDATSDIVGSSEQKYLGDEEIIQLSTYIPVLRACNQNETASEIDGLLRRVVKENEESLNLTVSDYDLLTQDTSKFYDSIQPKFP